MQKEHHSSRKKHHPEAKAPRNVRKSSPTKRTERHEEALESYKVKRPPNLEAGDQAAFGEVHASSKASDRLIVRDELLAKHRSKGHRTSHTSEDASKGSKDVSSSRKRRVDREKLRKKNVDDLPKQAEHTNLASYVEEHKRKKDSNKHLSNGSNSIMAVESYYSSSEHVRTLGRQAKPLPSHVNQKPSKAATPTGERQLERNLAQRNSGVKHFNNISKSGQPEEQKRSSIKSLVPSQSNLESEDEQYGSDFEQSDLSTGQSLASAEMEGEKSGDSQPSSPVRSATHGTMSVVISTNKTCGAGAAMSNISLNNSSDVHTIDFSRSLRVGAHQLRQRLEQRAKDLFRLIELDFAGTGHIFELKPVDEYANYMLRFGRANRNQVHVQTNDDALEREIQTDPIEVCKHGGVWTQWPVFGTEECSGHRTIADEKFYPEAERTLLEEEYDPIAKVISEVVQEFTSRLMAPIEARPTSVIREQQKAFIPLSTKLLPTLRYAMNILEEEDRLNSELLVSSIKNKLLQDQPASSTLQLESGSLDERRCVACAFSSTGGDRLLTIHRPKKQCHLAPPDDLPGLFRLAGETICVWSIATGLWKPEYMLYCPGMSEAGLKGANISCAVFSPDSDASMVVGGLVDGTVCLWDLNVSSFDMLHTGNLISDSHKFCLKPPLYSTCGTDDYQHSTNLMKPNAPGSAINGTSRAPECDTAQHLAPIVDLQLTLCAKDKSVESTFQFTVLDAFGGISLWMVVKNVHKTSGNIYDMMAGSQSDLGLRPSDHVVQLIQLMRITTRTPLVERLSLTPNTRVNEENIATTSNYGDLEPVVRSAARSSAVFATVLAVTGSGNFLIGFTDGSLTQCPRSSGYAIFPERFARPRNKACLFSLAVNPDRSMNLAIAGYADGIVRLYQLNNPCALQQWNLSVCRMEMLAVTQLCWSDSTPSIFFSLDTSGRLMMWDVSKHLENQFVQKNVFGDDPQIGYFSLYSNMQVNLKGRLQQVLVFALTCSNSIQLHWIPSGWLIDATYSNPDCQS